MRLISAAARHCSEGRRFLRGSACVARHRGPSRPIEAHPAAIRRHMFDTRREAKIVSAAPTQPRAERPPRHKCKYVQARVPANCSRPDGRAPAMFSSQPPRVRHMEPTCLKFHYAPIVPRSYGGPHHQVLQLRLSREQYTTLCVGIGPPIGPTHVRHGYAPGTCLLPRTAHSTLCLPDFLLCPGGPTDSSLPKSSISLSFPHYGAAFTFFHQSRIYCNIIRQQVNPGFTIISKSTLAQYWKELKFKRYSNLKSL